METRSGAMALWIQGRTAKTCRVSLISVGSTTHGGMVARQGDVCAVTSRSSTVWCAMGLHAVHVESAFMVAISLVIFQVKPNGNGAPITRGAVAKSSLQRVVCQRVRLDHFGGRVVLSTHHMRKESRHGKVS